MDALIREAAIADYAGLDALWGEGDALHHGALPGVFAPPVHPARSIAAMAAILDDPRQCLLVAEVGARVVGLLHITLRERYPPMVARQFAMVEAIVVAAEDRGGGVGHRLMMAAHRWAAARDAAEVWLDVWEFNVGAIRFYEGLGYETLSRRMRTVIVRPTAEQDHS